MSLPFKFWWVATTDQHKLCKKYERVHFKIFQNLGLDICSFAMIRQIKQKKTEKELGKWNGLFTVIKHKELV